MNRAVWYLLVDKRGQPAFDDVGADKVKISTDADVADVRDSVWEENQRIIEGVAAQLKVYSNKDNIANPAMALKASALVGDGGGSEDMPLFVVVPKKTSPSGSLQSIASNSMDVDVRWKDEAPIVYSLEKGSMFFVNRTDAVKQLHEIHRSKFERAVSRVGKEWIIPIADNVIGLGKSEFGRHYIRKSREAWPEAVRRDSFQQHLCDCHTVAIEFRRGALLRGSFDVVMLKYLKEALEPMFITPPSTLSINYEAADDFLVDLTKVTGPVFIVLDEIRKAFQSDSLDDFQQRDCHGSYLNYVAQRPLDIHIKPNQYVFERLNIHNVSSSA
ncbi:hypothetical protein HDU80_009993 [Chytriomyces hyalinus]|nr:hypothetical protein HDU80_009993 [Chytriomyces hyalinus]